ncbi:gp53-like domain-containing protein [Phascolarctobacterium faecium]|uniref:gp53-like domain-containing protein n=1 Tax=Phascolarctobacterium faecium TaxID=33025 RepID=UPI003AB7F567
MHILHFWACFHNLSIYLQWGINTGWGTQTKTFPIAFGTIFTAVSNGINQWHTGQCNTSTTQITTYCYHSDSPNNTEGGPVKWIAIGVG